MIKLTYCLRRLPRLSREQFQDYWRHTHGPLVQRSAQVLNIRRYVQLHTAGHPLNDALRKSGGGPEPYDGVAELWFDSVESLTAPASTPQGRAAMKGLQEDLKNFVDQTQSPQWIATEQVLIGE